MFRRDSSIYTGGDFAKNTFSQFEQLLGSSLHLPRQDPTQAKSNIAQNSWHLQKRKSHAAKTAPIMLGVFCIQRRKALDNYRVLDPGKKSPENGLPKSLRLQTKTPRKSKLQIAIYTLDWRRRMFLLLMSWYLQARLFSALDCTL